LIPHARQQSARALAFDLGRWSPGPIVASPERKALETGNEMSAVLDLGVTTNDDLQEQGFGSVRFRRHSRRRFETTIMNPSRRCSAMSPVTPLQGVSRMRSIGFFQPPSSNGPPIVVTHGRILASFLSRLTGEDAFAIWKSLRLPDAMMVDLERRKFSTIR